MSFAESETIDSVRLHAHNFPASFRTCGSGGGRPITMHWGWAKEDGWRQHAADN